MREVISTDSESIEVRVSVSGNIFLTIACPAKHATAIVSPTYAHQLAAYLTKAAELAVDRIEKRKRIDAGHVRERYAEQLVGSRGRKS